MKKKARSLAAKRGWATRKRKAEARSRAAQKGWRTRREKERQQKIKVNEGGSVQMLLDFVEMNAPDEKVPQLEGLIENNFGKKGFTFDLSGGILKISIATDKTRKKFSVRR